MIDGIVVNNIQLVPDSTGPDATVINDELYYANDYHLVNKSINTVYYYTDTLGHNQYYGSYDNSKDLANFKPLGLSIILFMFSLYLFFVATKLYHQYFDKKFKEQIIDYVFYLGSISLIVVWVMLVLSNKGIPIDFINFELINFPNQFVLGVVLSSLLLLGIGIFRFTIIAFISNPVNSENITSDIRLSFVGFVFGLLSLIANIWTIWSAFN